MVRLAALLTVTTLLLAGCPAAGPSTGDDGGPTTDQDANNPSAGDNGAPDEGSDDAQAARAIKALAPTTWFVVGYSSASNFTGTAFAVGADRFATTARLALSIQQVQNEPSPHTFLFQNETGARRTIVAAWLHPDFSAQAANLSTPDVALLRAPAESDQEAPFEPLKPAANEVLHGLRELDDFIICGFPPTVSLGIDLANVILGDGEFHPRATSVWGAFSALRPLDPAQSATPENTQLVQFVIPRLNGMAGSPLVTAEGAVIGLHSVTVGTGEDIHFGLRADALAELIQKVDAGEVPNVLPTADK